MNAKLYRMVTESHICPFGIRAKHLLESEGYTVEDIHLKTREETDEFKEKYNVKTTPQAFIDDKRIGGYDDLVKFFKRSTLKQEGLTYQPIIAIFSATAVMALALVVSKQESLLSPLLIQSFIAISMCVLAILKLKDLYSFTNQFITYDILAQKKLGYAYLYPFLEFIVGAGMIANLGIKFLAPISIFIGSIGAISVIKAVYIEKRDIKCACVGGDSNVPLGFISLTENLFMIFIGAWMLIK